MPPLVRGGQNAPVSAGQWGQQAMPLMQPSFTPTRQTVRAATLGINPEFRAKYGISGKENRPYADVGKMTLNLSRPEAFAENVPHAQGLVEGFGAGVGRMLGGVVGQGQAGADIGQFIGKIGQAPLDLAAGVAGALPALPGLPGSGGMPGLGLLQTDQATRDKWLDENWDGNPFGLFKAMGEYDKDRWNADIEAGKIDPLWRSFGPATSFGDQLMNILGMTGVPSDLIQRGWAGGPGQAIKRVLSENEKELSPEIIALKKRYLNHELTDEQMLDQLVVNGAGYSNNWVVNLLGSGILDPANLAFGAGAAIGFANKGAKAAQAIKFVDGLGEDALKGLTRSAAEQATLAGRNIAEGSITPLQVMQEAQRLGTYGSDLSKAQRALPARQQLALSPAAGAMERVADVTQKVLDPFTNIGMRGTKPLENAYLSREATKGIAKGHGEEVYAQLSDEMSAIGKGDLFDEGVGYYGAQEGVLMAGDELRNDVQHVRRVSSARPTDVALARAKVGTQNYAMKMEKWVARRRADYAMLTGGTKEEALKRAADHATDRLVRMGVAQSDAVRIVGRLGEDGYSLIDGMYFGHRIAKFNRAKRAARESLASVTAAKKPGPRAVAAGTSDRLARQEANLERATLIGPRELTDLRAKSLRQSLDAGDIDAVKADVRKYDRLAMEFMADGLDDQTLISGVKSWLDEFESGLTKELDEAALKKGFPKEMVDDALTGDGYVYGLRPDGDDEWRVAFHADDVLDADGNVIAKAGDIKHADPWIDIVGDAAQPWNFKFRDRGDKFTSFANAVEGKVRLMGRMITSDKIDREVRRDFIERAILKHDEAVEGQVGGGLNYREARDLYDGVKRRALEAKTSPRGLGLDEFTPVLKGNAGALRVGMSERDLQLLTLQAFEGNVGTVGLSQKLTGRAKVVGMDIPFLPTNSLGQIAERMFPLVRFSLNPLFQLQEWVEPWIFSAARGRKATLTGGWEVYDPVLQATRKVDLEDVDLIQKNMIERYRAANPEAQFDMMERSLVYLHGQKAAKEAAAAVDKNIFSRAISGIAAASAGERKRQAQSEMFRYFLGPMLKNQFDKINPNIWIDLEREFGTKDLGTIAVRWVSEKSLWADADPRVAYHIMDMSKEAAYGARAAVNLEENAQRIFKSSREALNTQVKDGTMTRAEFHDLMTDAGAHPDYIDRTWKAMQFDAKTGGVDQWWEDAIPLVPGGANEVHAVRTVVKALAEVHGISETELLSRTLQTSPVSLLHDDFIGATTNELGQWGMLLQQSKEMADYIRIDDITGEATLNPVFRRQAEDEFLEKARNPPDFIPKEQHGNTANMERVTFGDGGRDLFIPGGKAALADLETPWTAWEAHVIRAQVINPNDLKDPILKHALDEKMWRGHTIDMSDPNNVHALFNNYTFAMHSANMSLTRNEMVATRFRVGSREELEDLANTGTALRRTIEDSPDYDPGRLVNDLGFAYSTSDNVSHYIPLDARQKHYKAGMLPERRVLNKQSGKMEKVRGTQDMVEERAGVASAYLRGTSKDARGQHAAIEELQDAHAATLKGEARKKYKEKAPGRLQHWAIDQWLAHHVDVKNVDVDTLDAFAVNNPMFGLKRGAQFSDDEITAITKAMDDLAKDPLDINARAVLAPHVKKMKDMDDTIIFKRYNVNGAGLTPQKVGKNEDIFHGDDDLFAYLKNDDVAWRGTATSANMGKTLLMARDMIDNPQHYTRRRIPGVADVAGKWKSSPYADKSELVPVAFLRSLPPGNRLGKTDMEALKADISANGFDEAIPLTYSAKDGTILMDEGNHRLQAALELGMNDVPVRFVRTERALGGTKVPGMLPDAHGYTPGDLKPSQIGVPTSSLDETLEPLDEMGERIAHRTDGLSLKTGFFGADLGDPMNFNRGVHDLHMVGEMTEWMYHVKGANGTNKVWKDWLASLTEDKQKLINRWITEKGARKGAGVFKWQEATGLDISFKPGKAAARELEAGSVAAKAAWVRKRLDEAAAGSPGVSGQIGPEQVARMRRMYRTDEEWAELYGRDLKMYGGDYKVFEDTMSLRKAEEEAAGGAYAEGLKRHGNGGFQWKLWDERRHIWDPETTAFASTHAAPKKTVRYMASSDDGHSVAGFYNNLGQPATTGPDAVPISLLDPWNTYLPQTDGRVIRGATIMTDTGERIIGLTKYRNRSTFLHEVTHAVIEPLLTDPSLKAVVYGDLNRVIGERNATLLTRTADLKVAVDEAAEIVADHTNALVDANTRLAAAAKEATDSELLAKRTARQAQVLHEQVITQQATLREIKKAAPAKRKAALARKSPSDQAKGIGVVERSITEAQLKLDDLVATRDQIRKQVEPTRLDADAAKAAHASAKEDVSIISTNLTQRKAEGAALKAEYDKVATQMPEALKNGWDAEVSEHFADEFAKWLATGKVENPKMRDAFAYFRNVLIRIFKWSKDQPGHKVSPEMEKLFNDLTNPQVEERVLMANAVPFDATQEMMHAAATQSVVDAEDAAHTNVQFRRSRSWLERSINHPYFGIYPASYMWGKVAPEMIRALAVNPFGIPVPFLTKPVKIGGGEYGLHGSPFAGFTNAARVQSSIELQKDTDPEFAASMNDPKNQQVFRNMAMFLPATPWDIPANFPLWSRRVAEYGLEAQEAALKGDKIPNLNPAKLGSEVASYAFGLKASFDWLDDTTAGMGAPIFGGGDIARLSGPKQLEITPTGTIETQLGEASAQLRESLMK